MDKMKSSLAMATIFFLVTSCSTNDELSTMNPVTGSMQINFTSSVGSATKATSLTFDVGDSISVFAVEKSANNLVGQLMSSNFADNVKYTYDGKLFQSLTPISYPNNGNGLFFHAVYPYQRSINSNFYFTVKNRQDQENQYTQSDLMTAVTDATKELTPNLKFSHRLSNIVVNLDFEQTPTSEVSLVFSNVARSVIANLNTNVFEPTASPTGPTPDEGVCAAYNGTNSYKAILPPQSIEKGLVFATVVIGTKSYPLAAPSNITWRSGMQYEYKLFISNNGKITFTADINPWGEDANIEETVPPAILDAMKPYITIYSGNTPPDIEGTYLIEPMTTVYCQDEGNGGYEKGTVVSSKYIKFTNQNNDSHTIAYSAKSASGNDTAEGKGAFISGSANNFTVYLDTEGESYGIYNKTALVISGTKTDTGIKGLRYAFVMVEKGDDPDKKLMAQGVYRIFEDGSGEAAIANWPIDTKTLSPLLQNSYNEKSYNIKIGK